MSSRVWSHVFTPAEKREIMDRAVVHMKDSRNRPEHRETWKKSGLQITLEGLSGQKWFSMKMGLPFDSLWMNGGKALRYQFNSNAGKIKVAQTTYNGKDPILYINSHHLTRLDADIYVRAVGDEYEMKLIGWAHTEEFWGPLSFIHEFPNGPVRAIRQEDLRPMPTLSRLIHPPAVGRAKAEGITKNGDGGGDGAESRG